MHPRPNATLILIRPTALSSLQLVVCIYVDGFNSSWRQCGSTSRYWPISLVLAILPFLVRLIQSIKRYVDSGLNTHLINVWRFIFRLVAEHMFSQGGKYAAGIVSYLCYFIWRKQGQISEHYH